MSFLFFLFLRIKFVIKMLGVPFTPHLLEGKKKEKSQNENIPSL